MRLATADKASKTILAGLTEEEDRELHAILQLTAKDFTPELWERFKCLESKVIDGLAALIKESK